MASKNLRRLLLHFRLSLPLAWRGLREGELFKECGVDGCIFVHIGGFIGGTRTYEGARQMAISALEEGQKNNEDSTTINT